MNTPIYQRLCEEMDWYPDGEVARWFRQYGRTAALRKYWETSIRVNNPFSTIKIAGV